MSTLTKAQLAEQQALIDAAVKAANAESAAVIAGVKAEADAAIEAALAPRVMTQEEAMAALAANGNPYYRFDSVETGETLAVGTLFHMKRVQDADQRATLEGLGDGISKNTVQVGMDIPVTCTLCVSHGTEEEGTLGEAKTIGGVDVQPVYRASQYTNRRGNGRGNQNFTAAANMVTPE